MYLQKREETFNLSAVPNNFFQFKQFIIHQEKCGMRVSTDACILGAWYAGKINQYKNILDIGCGTGLLTLMLSQKNIAYITGIELEIECYEQAKENILNSPWQDRCTIYNGDIRYYQFKNRFDFIISNPPFFDNQLSSPNQKKNQAKHGETLTLGELSKAINDNLTDEGAAGLLIPFYRTDETIQLFNQQNLHLHQMLKIRQTDNHDFFRSVLFFKRAPSKNIIEESMTIKKGDQYSEEFIELLKDYYLHL